MSLDAALAWALAQAPGSRALALAMAMTGGTRRVTHNGSTVEYASIEEMHRVLIALHHAAIPSRKRPSVTLASFRS